MTSRRDDAQNDVFHPDNLMDEVFARANPNPERKDCPSDDVLRELAATRRPIGDPGYEHLAQCSPCYRTFRTFQREQRARKPGEGSGHWRWVAAAAVLLFAAVGVWFVASRSMVVTVVDGTELYANMDLRKYAVDRSGEATLARQPLVAKRARLALTIVLPVGSEAGSYELQVMDSALRSRSAALGEARIEDFATTLHTRIDLRGVPFGDYKLAVRRKGEDWRLFPLRVE